jgi:hypothetical protein
MHKSGEMGKDKDKNFATKTSFLIPVFIHSAYNAINVGLVYLVKRMIENNPEIRKQIEDAQQGVTQ